MPESDKLLWQYNSGVPLSSLANEDIFRVDQYTGGSPEYETNFVTVATMKTELGTGGVLTTVGDLLGYNGAEARFPVSGNDGYVLTEDSGDAFGFSWQASSGLPTPLANQSVLVSTGTGSGADWNTNTQSNIIESLYFNTAGSLLPVGADAEFGWDVSSGQFVYRKTNTKEVIPAQSQVLNWAIADEFDTNLTEVTPVSGDHVLIEDASDSFNKKYVDASDFLAGGLPAASGNPNYAIPLILDRPNSDTIDWNATSQRLTALLFDNLSVVSSTEDHILYLTTSDDRLNWHREPDEIEKLAYVSDIVAGYETILKPSDESVTSSTVLQDDDDLVFAMDANSSYEGRIVVYCTGDNTADISTNITVPTGASIKFGGSGLENGAAASGAGDLFARAQIVDTLLLVFGVGSTTAVTTIILEFTAVTAGTAGDLQFQFAQGTSNATATTVLEDSKIIYKKVA